MLDEKKNARELLHRLADLIANEAERNQRFAAELQEILGTREGGPKKTRTQPPSEDPFEAYRTKGEVGFKSWLETFDVATLKAMVRQHRLDPSRLSDKWKTKARFVSLIVERVPARLKQGDVFRHYGERDDAPDKGGTPS